MKHSKYSPNTYLAVAGMAVLWFCAIAVILSMSSCSGAQPRDVIYRAKVINYSAVTSSFYPSTTTYLVSVDSAYRSSDTIIFGNERYLLLERSK